MDVLFRGGADMEEIYRNPVMRGFFPDPSILRVGQDYYIVTSTFQYFPAITISHSRDLIHWEIIGHGITDPEFLNLDQYSDGMGIWAPSICYYNGMFCILLCLVEVSKDRKRNIRGNYIIKSKTPEGPYSRPVRLTEEGNDPSLFVEDGKCYLIYGQGEPVSKGAKLIRLDSECTKTIGEPVVLEWDFGTEDYDAFHVEGPYIFKRGNYYYHIIASCHSIYADTHHSMIGRSEKLEGPYKTSPYNPFIYQKDEHAVLQKAGHGNLVRTQNGEWWAPYLCMRPVEGYSILGRETAMDPVQWKEDGWPVLNHGNGPSERNRIPGLPYSPVEKEEKDHFDKEQLDHRWMFVRNPDPFRYSLKQHPGYLRIYASPYDVDHRTARNIILQRQTSHKFTAELKMEFAPDRSGQQAGMLNYYDTSSYLKFAVEYRGGIRIFAEQNGYRKKYRVCERELGNTDVIYLRIQGDGNRRRLLYSADGEEWFLLCTLEHCSYLSDEGTCHWGFMGSMLGMFAADPENQSDIFADFDYFKLENR